jgi:hypothetical protein
VDNAGARARIPSMARAGLRFIVTLKYTIVVSAFLRFLLRLHGIFLYAENDRGRAAQAASGTALGGCIFIGEGGSRPDLWRIVQLKTSSGRSLPP